jgi:hypothetical protein
VPRCKIRAEIRTASRPNLKINAYTVLFVNNEFKFKFYNHFNIHKVDLKKRTVIELD